MVAIILILIITLLSVAHFYLKSGALVSFATFAASVFGVIVAFSYYEPLTNMLLARGYGGQWGSAGIYVVLFVVTFAIIRAAADFIFGQDVDLGNVITKIIAIVCGVLTGLIISGVILVALALAPTSPKLPYARLGDGDSVVTIAKMRSPVNPVIRADGIVTELFGWISRGSLSSKKSFAVYHADFLNQVHLNKYMAKKKIYTVAGNRAVRVPKKGVRKLDSDNDNLTVVRMEVKNADIKSGGARGAEGDVSFMLGQVRLICKQKGQTDTLEGSAIAVYPKGRIVSRRLADKDAEKKGLTGALGGRVLEKRSLHEIITLDRDEFKIGGRNADARVDLAFDVPSSMEAVLLEFKQNVAVEVPASAPASEEGERLLNSSGGKPPAGGSPEITGPGDPNT